MVKNKSNLTKGLIKIDLQNNTKTLVCELIEKAKLKGGDILVVGCSSSEIIGEHIGKNSSLESAEAVFAGLYPLLEEAGIYLAAQCCEHLNRALIVERECAEKKGLEIVNVVPRPSAGGSFATTAYNAFKEPVAVEFIKADAGLDIGQTLVGMHLKHVAVPVRLSQKMLGNAVITAARTRHKFIGGSRAIYEPEKEVRD